jgi:hypothetical protein
MIFHLGLVVISVPKVTLRKLLHINGLFDDLLRNSLRITPLLDTLRRVRLLTGDAVDQRIDNDRIVSRIAAAHRSCRRKYLVRRACANPGSKSLRAVAATASSSPPIAPNASAAASEKQQSKTTSRRCCGAATRST